MKMTALSNITMTLKVKLTLSYILVIVLISATSISSYFNMKSSMNKLDDMLKINMIANSITNSAQNINELLSGYILDQLDEKKKTSAVVITEMRTKVDLLNQYTVNSEDLAYVDNIKNLVDVYEEVVNTMFQKGESKDNKLISEVALLKDDLRKKYGYLQTEVSTFISQELQAQQVVKSKLSKQANRTGILIFLVILMVGSLTVFFAIRFANKVGNAVMSMANYAQKIADGDLYMNTLDVDQNANDELSKLAKSFNDMMVNLRHIIGNIQASSKEVSHTSEVFRAGEEHNSKAMEQISSAVMQVAQGASEQAELSQNIDEIISLLFEMNRQNVDQLLLASSSASKANNHASTGYNEMKKLKQQMEETAHKIISAQDATNSLKLFSGQITKVLQTIMNITAEINFLSLNASIEAARAGVHGKGFAVVANEVKRLANNTKVSSNEVASILGQIMNKTNEIAQSMDVGVDAIRHGLSATDEVTDSLGKIVDANDVVDNQMKQISELLDVMVRELSRVKDMSHVITGVSTNALHGSQEVAAAIEERTASQQEMLASANVLSNMSEKLNAISKRFRLSDNE